MENQPQEITPVKLDAVLMPNGEIICLGKTIGRFRELKKYLTPKVQETGELTAVCHTDKDVESKLSKMSFD